MRIVCHVFAKPKSGFVAQTKSPAQLKSPPQELAKEDGVSGGMRSMAGSGTSFMALPGVNGQPFNKGDWLIRAIVQEAKD